MQWVSDAIDAFTPASGLARNRLNEIGLCSALVLAGAPEEAVAVAERLIPCAEQMALAPAVCTFLCFDLYEDGIRVGHDVDVMTAVKFCSAGGPPPLPIETLALGQRIKCYPYQGHQRWVIRTK